MAIALNKIFKANKPIIGMVHLPASPGQPQVELMDFYFVMNQICPTPQN